MCFLFLKLNITRVEGFFSSTGCKLRICPDFFSLTSSDILNYTVCHVEDLFRHHFSFFPIFDSSLTEENFLENTKHSNS